MIIQMMNQCNRLSWKVGQALQPNKGGAEP
jgi:hypothetical protein